MIEIGSAVAYLNLDPTGFNNALYQAESSLQDFKSNLEKSTGSALTDLGSSLTNLGSKMTNKLTIPLVNFGESSIQAFRDYESAFAGVKKTIDDEDLSKYGVTYDQLSEAIRKMATETASSAEDIAAVMEMAGQLGIPLGDAGKDITEFTKAMVMLGDSTNVTAEDAAISLAKFMNITGTAADESLNLGSAIVDLGNNFATQEDQIINMSTRLASAGTMAGLTTQEVLALATAMSSVGIRAEAGGSAMSTTLTQIEKIVQGVGENATEQLNTLGKVAGMSAEEFANAWKEDPIEALQAFLLGLGKLDEQGESAVVILDELGMKGVRQSNMLKALALSGENLTSAIQTSNKAWEEQSALEEEANKRYETLDSRLSQLNERWKEMKRDIAELLLPVLERLLDIIEKLMEKWNGLTDSQKNMIINIGLVAAAAGPLLIILGQLLSAIGNIVNFINVIKGLGVAKGLTNVSGTLSGIAGGIKKVFSLLAPFTDKILGIGSSIAGVIIFVKNFIDMWVNGVDIMKFALSVLSGAVVGLGLVLAGIAGWPAIIAGAAIGAIAAIVAKIHENWDGIKAWGQEVAEGVKEWWNGFCEKVKIIWDMHINAIKQGLDNFVDKVHEIIEKVKEFVTNASENIKEGVTNAIEHIKETVSKFWENLKDILENIWNKVKEVLQNIFDTVSEILNNIFDTIKEIAENIKNWVVDKITEIKEKIAEKIEEIKEAIREKIEMVRETIQNAVEAVIETLKALGEKILEIVNNVVETVKRVVEQFKELITQIVEGIKRLVSQVIQIIGDLVRKFVDSVVEIWNTLINSVKEVFENIVQWFKEKFDETVEKVKEMVEKFKDIGKELIEKIWEGMKSAWEKLSSWFSEKFGKIGETISNVANKVKGLFSSASSNGPNGSHSAGLDYVPFDGYVAQLHKGERVLTKQENKDYNNNNTTGGDTYNFYNTKDDPYEYSRQMKRVKKELAFT